MFDLDALEQLDRQLDACAGRDAGRNDAAAKLVAAKPAAAMAESAAPFARKTPPLAPPVGDISRCPHFAGLADG